MGTMLRGKQGRERAVRQTARTALPDAAKMELSLTGGFLWLHYQQMGCLIQRVAKGLVRLQVTAQQLLFKSPAEAASRQSLGMYTVDLLEQSTAGGT